MAQVSISIAKWPVMERQEAVLIAVFSTQLICLGEEPGLNKKHGSEPGREQREARSSGPLRSRASAGLLRKHFYLVRVTADGSRWGPKCYSITIHIK